MDTSAPNVAGFCLTSELLMGEPWWFFLLGREANRGSFSKLSTESLSSLEAVAFSTWASGMGSLSSADLGEFHPLKVLLRWAPEDVKHEVWSPTLALLSYGGGLRLAGWDVELLLTFRSSLEQGSGEGQEGSFLRTTSGGEPMISLVSDTKLDQGLVLSVMVVISLRALGSMMSSS